MPPRRRAPPTTTPKPTSTPRPSKLAKEHHLTALEESEIHEAFSLFAEPLATEPLGVIPISDVRRALIALGIPPSSPAQLADLTAALDPDEEGFATYEAFVGVCALQMQVRRFEEEEEEEGEGGGGEGHRRELEEAYGLFTGGREGEGGEVITLGDLRRVAALLRLDAKGQGKEGGGGGGGGGGKGKGDGLVVTEEVLRDMILEANGGAGVGRGVKKEEFDGVMRRAGVWR
ncbi:hypothetical protein F5144DRAFT_530878 [Chaetomium tenue]|uniref:Uncharacterized protein n=1 Tax=Chaetomium tenue TaxID=1854479 RepID=A0ACB7PDK1_9PEZI|nr:hypothetical protein F5144DRAFT_530878 [Chaetomium globosum]